MRRFILSLTAIAGLVHSQAYAADDASARPTLPPSVEAFSNPPAEYADKLGSYKPLLQKADGTPIKTPDEWQQKRKEIKQYWQELMGPWPKLLEDPKVEILEEEKRGDILQQHLRLEIAPGRFTEDC